MRGTRILAGALLTTAVLASVVGVAGTALADTSSPSPSPSTSAADAPPTEAGTSFRTAAAFQQGQQATADASTGDYLYWVFPADSGQNVTVRATVTFPRSATRSGASTWQLDVYDGLRRHQPCRYGMNTRPAPADVSTINLSCTLRTVRAWSDAWSDEPLRGAYYVRLTVTDVPEADLGLPVDTAVEATSTSAGASQAVDGSVTPVVSRYGPVVRPDDGWAGTWWSTRWLWTGAGGVLGALAGVGGYALTRGSGRPRRTPREI